MTSIVHTGDCLTILPTLPEQSVQCVVTSPPYWNLRDYGVDGQLGLEQTPDEYVANMVAVFREVWRVLRDDGTCWVNMGDSYAGGKQGRSDKLDGGQLYDGRQAGWQDDMVKQNKVPPGLKPKDLVGIPWRLAFALQADGWYLRSDIIWSKPNPMPESVTDRPTKAHEYVFLLTKRSSYFYDADAVREVAKYGYREHTGEMRSVSQDGRRHTTGTTKGGDPSANRNRRSVWTIPTQAFSKAHFATFPEKLVEPCIMAGTSEKGCCPECGAPWKRVVEKGVTNRTRLTGIGQDSAEGTKGRAGEFETRTTGWEPGCECKWYKPKPDIPEPSLDTVRSLAKLSTWRNGYVSNAGSASSETDQH